MLFYETDPCTVSGFPGMGGEIFCIQIIERLKAHVRRSLLLLQEGAFPGGGVPFGFKAPFQLLAALACPVLIGKFTVPGITGFIFVLCHIHFPFIPAGLGRMDGRKSGFDKYVLLAYNILNRKAGREALSPRPGD